MKALWVLMVFFGFFFFFFFLAVSFWMIMSIFMGFSRFVISIEQWVLNWSFSGYVSLVANGFVLYVYRFRRALQWFLKKKVCNMLSLAGRPNVVQRLKRNVKDINFDTILCHNSPYGELWLTKVCLYMAY